MDNRLKLGFRAHDFGHVGSAEKLAKLVSSYRNGAYIHLAPYKVLDNVPSVFNDKWAESLRRTFDSFNVKVAVLGCYINPMHPDSDVLEKQLCSFENGLEIAQTIGCNVVATETGSVDERNIRCEETWTDKNFSLFLKRTERLLKCAEKNNAVMALEAVADKNTLDTPQRMYKVMETFKSSNLRVLFDAVNIFPIHGVDNIESYYDEAVSMLAPYISVMHIKDYKFVETNREYPYATGQVKNGNLPVGTGLMPWDVLFEIYKKYSVDRVPMTLENFREETLKESIEYCDKAYSKCLGGKL